MRTVVGILTMLAGVIFPMVMVGWLAVRMGRKPRPPARLIGLVLAFNGVLPVGLVLLGLGMLMPQLWTITLVRAGAYAALFAAMVILVLLRSGRKPDATMGGRDA